MRTIQNGIEEKLETTIRTLQTDGPMTEEVKKKLATQLRSTKSAFDKLQTWVGLSQEVADIGLWEYDIKNNELMWSDETFRIWGYEPDEIVPSDAIFMERIHPEDRDKVRKKFKQSLEKNSEYHIIYRLLFPDGKIKFVEAHAVHFHKDGKPVLTIGTNQNITTHEIEKQEIEKALESNQVILDEIHHRVKNNLAVVAGLLQLQWLQEDDPVVTEKLQDSATRIRTIAGIHQHLYQSDSFANVALGENLEKLAKDLIKTMQQDVKVELKTNCDEVYLDFERILPCSLIVNELVTNVLKHAFQDQKGGVITIDLLKENNKVVLRVADNGKGLPDNFDEMQGSLGVRLIKTLNNQLQGDYTFRSDESGTTFTIAFSMDADYCKAV
ncbi:hypothetical protein CK503_02535 [Aliifodinibius salipaludis]|uniref:histidine kinase n=1 Tax=Fodinibius salipaludis TaxID=2032627 RepID=A0A2A2GBL5_9BACT|nr:histidine kinase dimerization/phosphoacceptor domain -containing protein [Aliifodinibius salipaludis]PAU95096.1 hypothetical protein CK503_02535 [Aliifodinibius salipaludis]